MTHRLEHLGPYSDLVPLATRANKLWPPIIPGPAASRRFLAALHFNPRPPTPLDLRIDHRWTADGLHAEALSWSVGYGPRTCAWLFKPDHAPQKLPAVLLLHDHGGYKYYGKEKVADGPAGPIQALQSFRADYYGNLPIANALAKQGFVVLVHDTFLWGSRKFPLQQMIYENRPDLKLVADAAAKSAPFPEIAYYNSFAAYHENIVEKYAHVLGTSFAGIVNFEDRTALNVLAARKDILPGRLGCLGLSGGGMRSVLLNATAPKLKLKAAVVIGAMSTYPGLLDAHIIKHTWLFFPSAFSPLGDWPAAAAARAPSPLLVQYCRQDPLFSPAGMNAAHRRIQATFRRTPNPKNYRGLFYPTTHQFNRPMQQDAFAFLNHHLRRLPAP